MKDSDEYQRTGPNHTGHALFTAPQITHTHILPSFIQSEKSEKNDECDANAMRSQKMISILLIILNKKMSVLVSMLPSHDHL